MKSRGAVRVKLLLAVSVLPVFGVSGQTLLTQAFLSGAGGVYVVTNSVDLTIGATPGHDDHPTQLLFTGLWVTAQDVGITYTMGPNDNPANFSLFTSYLTSNSLSYMCDTLTMGPGAGSESGILPSKFFASLPPGGNGFDLAGFNIDYYTLEFTGLTFSSPGSNPNGNGIWTDYTYSATFSVYGQPVPEPGMMAILSLETGVLLAMGRPSVRRAWRGLSVVVTRPLRATPVLKTRIALVGKQGSAPAHADAGV
jgi:hypothetical protein